MGGAGGRVRLMPVFHPLPNPLPSRERGCLRSVRKISTNQERVYSPFTLHGFKRVYSPFTFHGFKRVYSPFTFHLSQFFHLSQVYSPCTDLREFLVRSFTVKGRRFLFVASFALLLMLPAAAWPFASNNIPLDSPAYGYLEKLAGFGLVQSDLVSLRPYSKAEAARLVLEAQQNLAQLDGEALVFAEQLISRLGSYLSREIALKKGESAALFDFNPAPPLQLRYLFLDGVPRNYTRNVHDPANQSAFGFIGGNLRPQPAAIIGKSGTEGTPLAEYNEGVNYRRGSNAEARLSLEGFLTGSVALLVEPELLLSPGASRGLLRKGYLKLGGGGLELEAGRDANWFGPGRRGALTLSNNAQNFDLVKLSSPEPLDFDWVKSHVGQLKYALIFSRFDKSGSGNSLREPYFLGIKLALKANRYFEIGGNFVRQEGGPGFEGRKSTLQDAIFGGGHTNRNNSIAGIDLHFRIPQLRNSELYLEYAGEDSALFWPFIESYVAGVYLPRLSSSGRDDLRIEYFWGHPLLYSDHKFPQGYTNRGMSVGHAEGGGSQEVFARYRHWFSVRSNLALEYFYTDRGRTGRVEGQVLEVKHAGRAFYNRPLYGDLDLGFMYGWEQIKNLNLEPGVRRSNQLLKLELSYRY